VPLQRLAPGHLNTLYADLLERGLSARTVLHVHATIRRALADATRWGLVPRNVALLASPPRPGRTELQVWTAADLRSFLAHVEDDRLYALWLLAASTGMRRGEVLGVQWPDVDLARARVGVRRSLVTVGHQVVVSEPKTAKGRRSVALDPATVAAIKAGVSTRRPSGWPGGRPGPTRAWCSPGRTAGRSILGRSPERSPATCSRPNCR
jgi:integrase